MTTLYPFDRFDFVDAQEMHRVHPDTFEVPEQGDLDALAPGQYVKICLAKERFWVRLTQVGDTFLQGIVDNELFLIPEPKLGDHVEFERRHVYSILPEKP